jgi:transposase
MAHFAGLEAAISASRTTVTTTKGGKTIPGPERRLGELHMAQRQVLASLQDHWQGLTVFVTHPEVPMDNNTAEQAIRNPVTGRKNYYGSGSIWSAELAAAMFSLFQTVELWQINTRHWLQEYLAACAHQGGTAPEDLTPFLPWRMSEDRRRQSAKPPPRLQNTS